MRKRLNLSSNIARACISGKLPDKAIEWPIVEVVRTTLIIGGGESAQWRGMVTIRLHHSGLIDQVWRGSDGLFCDAQPLKSLYGDSLLMAEDTPKRILYVLKPVNP